MRLNLLGLDVCKAQELLAGEGISPIITVTSAPRRQEETRGTLRVVYASDDGARLTVARFLDPIEESGGNCESGGI